MISVERVFVHTEGDSLTRALRLYSCSFENAPERLRDPGKQFLTPRSGFSPSLTDTGIEEVGMLTQTLTDLDMEQFESKLKGNKRMFRIIYNFEVLLGAKEGLLQFRVMNNGREMGKCEIDYAND